MELKSETHIHYDKRSIRNNSGLLGEQLVQKFLETNGYLTIKCIPNFDEFLKYFSEKFDRDSIKKFKKIYEKIRLL